MRHVKIATLVLAGSTAMAGCAEDPTQPALTEGTAQVFAASRDLDLTASMTAAPARHLLVFRGKAPSDLEAQVTALGGTLALNHSIGVAVVTGLSDDDAAALGASSRADFVEASPVFQLVEPAAVAQPVRMSESEMAALSAVDVNSAQNPAGAILFARQWNMRQVHADAAWAVGRLGSPTVTVAILDTGIDYLLPDLAGRVDLNRSVSFEPIDDLFAATFYPDRHPSTDLHFHGTNVASQVASNAFAFAGVTSQTTLMSVKVCSVLGGCHGVIEGILYAIDNGADVINLSLGGWFQKSSSPGVVSAYNRIMNYAKQQGVTMVVAAGNDGNDLDRQDNIALYDEEGDLVDRVHVPSFWAAYCDASHVICVSATRRDDVPASYTNYGRSAIDVAAPGGGGGDWVYSLCPQTSLLFACEGGLFVLGVAGTSQAAPHVAGLAALAVQDVGRNPPQVAAYIRQSADAIDGGNTPFYGKGRINVARAVGVN